MKIMKQNQMNQLSDLFVNIRGNLCIWVDKANVVGITWGKTYECFIVEKEKV